MPKSVLLAFSGGLDTSYCVKYLQLAGYTVHCALVQTGGLSEAELAEAQQRAEMLGAATYKVLDRTEAFWQRCVKYLLFGNVLRGQTYPLSVSAERAFQAQALAEYARNLGVDALAHGATGAGNDQIRFDAIFGIYCPGLEILTPIRDQKLSRETEIAFLAAHGLQLDAAKAAYSINRGLWGTSVGGRETLTSDQPLPEDAWPDAVTATQSQTVTLGFGQGEPVSFNGQPLSPVALIRQLEQLAAPYGIGRDVHVGDTIVGLKGRVGFQAAAALILIKAHQLLEKHTLSAAQQRWKGLLADEYGRLIHEGQPLEPALRDIEALLASSQRYVTGTVSVRLLPYRFEALGVESTHDLMRPEFGAYGEANPHWSGADARGFAKVLANAPRMFYQVHPEALPTDAY